MNLKYDIFPFYKGKKVLVTGHTGFKGSWLCRTLVNLGAEVAGYALEPMTHPNLFQLSDIERHITHVIGDIRDFDSIRSLFSSFEPEIVFHLAAQPIVRESYLRPRYTYETNVMGTVNVMECVRCSDSVKSVLNVTTDKVYYNREWCWGYREDEVLNGYDPYSNSKSCSELITDSYKKCYFHKKGVAVSTARAGNVVGGGDFAVDRIIPDCVRAVTSGKSINVRNPYSVRPYQHVLEPVGAYLLIAAMQYKDSEYMGAYNIGPDEDGCIRTSELVDLFCEYWGKAASWNSVEGEYPHEANCLKLDCSKLKSRFGWQSKLSIEECIEWTCNFYKVLQESGDIQREMNNEIDCFFTDKNV